MSKRKILPRKDSSKYDSLSFGAFPDNEKKFNDQKTMVFTSSILDMPTGLPKDYSTSVRGTFRGSETYDDLVSSNSIYVTGNIKSPIFDHFMRIDPHYSSSSEPYKEVAQFEQGKFSDPFFATGSGGFVGDGSFSTPLKDKVKINLSFPIKQMTKMLETTCSIYYLNAKEGKWETPQGALPDLKGPFDKIGLNYAVSYYWEGDWPFPSSSQGCVFIEDQIGFDAYGNPVVSGSNNKLRKWKSRQEMGPEATLSEFNEYSESTIFTRIAQSDEILGTSPANYLGEHNRYLESKLGDMLVKGYSKNLSINQDYNANNEQLFTLPIEQPFLIEKIVYDIPFCLGDNWFLDKTASNWVLPSGSHTNGAGGFNNGIAGGDLYETITDEGGPGITVALHSQVPFGTSSIRDLISHTIFSHVDDYELGLKPTSLTSFWNEDNPLLPRYVPYARGHLVATGLKDICLDVGAVVSGNFNMSGKKYYTGSVEIKSTAAISNGVKIVARGGMSDNDGEIHLWYSPEMPPGGLALLPDTASVWDFNDFVDIFFGKVEKIKAGTGGVNTLTGINPFGRGTTTFSPSGGSIFGGEYNLPQDVKFNFRNLYESRNPFFTTSADDLKKWKENSELSASILHFLNYENGGPLDPDPRYDPFWRYDNGGQLNVYMFTDNRMSRKDAPYLVYPGQKLLVSVSKTRPVYSRVFATEKDANGTPPNTGPVGPNPPTYPNPPFGPVPDDFGRGQVLLQSSSYLFAPPEGHDVQFNTGSVNITIYGSYVKNGSSYIP